MNVKKLFALPTLALLLTGCGQEAKAPADEAAQNTEAKPVASELIEDGVLTVGTSADFPPYEYFEGDEIVGIDPEVVAAIGEKLGVEIEFKDMEFNNIIASLSSGRIDMGAAGLTVNEERKQNVDFTDTYGSSVQVFLVRDDGSIGSIDDVDGKKIGTQLGSVGDIYAKDDFGEENVNSFSKFHDAVLALQNNNVDCILMDETSALEYVKANPDLKILEEAYADEEYAFALPKGEEDFVKEINDIIAELKADGTIDSIFDKHIK